MKKLMILAAVSILALSFMTPNALIARPGCLEIQWCGPFWSCEPAGFCDYTPQTCDGMGHCGCCMIDGGGWPPDLMPCYCF